MRRKCILLVGAYLAMLAGAGCSKGQCGSDEDCDDGLYCNGAETCQSGKCVGSRIPDCDDGNPSTDDWCDDERGSCVHECLDVDGDGYFSITCGGDDCDDADELVYPGAEQRCDDVDDDCDGIVEEDRDEDGWYNDGGVCPDVDPPDVDCDDDEPSVHPGARELCNEIDENCVDGIADEADTDGDGHVEIGCGSSTGGDDCEDEVASIHPGADDTCNGIDDDCDDVCDDEFDCCVEETVACLTVCDSVGLGTCTDTCSQPEPAFCTPPEEMCNSVDDDCDDVVDEDLECEAGEVTGCDTTCETRGTGICTDECLEAPPEACNPPDEECNDVDDDCDDVVDDGFDCFPGTRVDCPTICDTDGWALCTDECTIPSPSVCTPATELVCNDMQDNDCDDFEDCWDEDCIGTIACGM